MIISVIGVDRVGVINHNLQDVSQGATLKQRYAINFRGSVHDRAISIRDAVLVTSDTELKKHLADVDKLKGFYTEAAEPLKVLMQRADVTEEEKSFYQRINEIEKTTLAATEKLISLRQQGQIQEAQAMLLSEVAPHYSAWLKSINNFIDYQEAYIKTKVGIVEQVANGFSLMMIVITLIAIVLGGFLAYLLIAYVNRLLGADPSQLNQYAMALAQGKFNSHFPVQTPNNSVLSALKLVQTNSQQAIEDANRVVGALAQGDFEQRVTSQMQGDWQQLKHGINHSAESISHVMSELDRAMNALKSGDFTLSIDTQASGQYGMMLSEAAHSLTSLNAVIRDIAEVMEAMSRGDFATRVNAQAQGELSSLKTSVNRSMETLDQLTAELVSMAQAQMRGDLTVSSTGNYLGRFKDLQEARTASTQKIKEMIEQAMLASQTVNYAAEQVAQGANELAKGMQQQSDTLAQTSGTMGQVASAVESNTQSARSVADLTQHAQQQANDGAVVMQETITAMQSIKASSHQIADIVTLIDSIAFQTNLLALNAAVEAARAGEHGRGFAVVASEVRALAGKSADAAKDIKTLINESVARIEKGTELADKSGEMLGSILSSVGQVADMVKRIAEASHEQNTGVRQVSSDMTSIDRMMQSNAQLIAETSAAAASLTQEANHLRENMTFFKTGQSHHSSTRPAVKASTSRKPAQALPSPKVSSASDEWSEF